MMKNREHGCAASATPVPPYKTSLLLIGLALILARPAPAEATRPLIRTATAIKNLQLSMPLEMKALTEKNLMGLNLEDPSVRKIVLKQASDYISYRKGEMKTEQAKKWFKDCESESLVVQPNPYCAYERERTDRAASAKLNTKTRPDRRPIATDLKEGRFDKAGEHEEADVMAAIKLIEEPGTLYPVANAVIGKKACVPARVSGSLAYKIEEHFPNPEAVETAKKLYQKASTCGADISAAKASFRLGLIQIWQKNCDGVQDLMKKVENLAEASAFHSRAKYWRYHCASLTGDDATKKAAKLALAREHRMSFHNLAANGDDETTMAEIIDSKEPLVSVRSFIRQDLNPLIRAGEALIMAGSNHLAAEFFDRKSADIDGLEPEVRLYTAMLLNRIGYALPKFKILSSLFKDVPRMVSQQTMRLYFPLWFFEIVNRKDNQVDPLLILSLIRQESAFNTEARSVVGARGLMQVMPATARSIASVRTQSLMDPKTNINVGTKYFLKRLNQYGGDVELTLAAYNAGFSRVDQWIKRYPTDNKLLFLDFIPFRETREYVSSILRNYYWYVKLYNLETKQAALEGVKLHAAGPKTLAIMSANAGAVATTRDPH